jgi:NADH-quinone oxidoreductase subunit N
MYFDETSDAFKGAAPAAGNNGVRVLLSANGVALLVLGVLPQPLMTLCFFAIKSL